VSLELASMTGCVKVARLETATPSQLELGGSRGLPSLTGHAKAAWSGIEGPSQPGLAGHRAQEAEQDWQDTRRQMP
jgi:hypothetical protein